MWSLCLFPKNGRRCIDGDFIFSQKVIDGESMVTSFFSKNDRRWIDGGFIFFKKLSTVNRWWLHFFPPNGRCWIDGLVIDIDVWKVFLVIFFLENFFFVCVFSLKFAVLGYWCLNPDSFFGFRQKRNAYGL